MARRIFLSGGGGLACHRRYRLVERGEAGHHPPEKKAIAAEETQLKKIPNGVRDLLKLDLLLVSQTGIRRVSELR